MYIFPALSCEFASLDVSDVLGTNRLNITKTIRKYAINKHLQATGAEFDPIPTFSVIKHDDKIDEEYGEGSVTLNSHNFDRISHKHNPTTDGRILLGKVDCANEQDLCIR
ncbi:hypothetical protein Hdeb2414_s0069g00771801 [Helianthus debilis subsp. tardiflorus]|nr:hypothetical protein HanLR1_Chr05g0192031 [Helianthus annuus]